ncbi:MAG: C45 family autoproteolytic acyltransferase/hydrolase [Thainema sp.]
MFFNFIQLVRSQMRSQVALGAIASLTVVLIVSLIWNPHLQATGTHVPIAQATDSPDFVWQPADGSWQPVPAHREDVGKVKVVWLQGTPYEMGYQHGSLLHDEIAELGPEVISAINFAGTGFGLGRLAAYRSFPGIVEECQGLVDATEDLGLTMAGCMTLSFGDVYQEYFTHLLPEILFNDGCAHFTAIGDATVDGGFYHGWTIDNNSKPIAYWVDNPVLFIRQPSDGIPHAFIALPGVTWPNGVMNAEGIIISNNTAHPGTLEELSLDGTSNVQLMGQVAKYARSFDDVKTILAGYEHMRANLIIVSDVKSKRAGVFELLGREVGLREIQDKGTIYMTNHFLAPETVGRDQSSESSFVRYERFEQLLEPDTPDSLYGKLNPQAMVKILRDRTNARTKEVSPLDVFDDDASIGGNGSQRQVVFDPANLRVWIANGDVPIPENPFTCFAVGELMNLPNAVSCGDLPVLD